MAESGLWGAISCLSLLPKTIRLVHTIEPMTREIQISSEEMVAEVTVFGEGGQSPVLRVWVYHPMLPRHPLPTGIVAVGPFSGIGKLTDLLPIGGALAATIAANSPK